MTSTQRERRLFEALYALAKAAEAAEDIRKIYHPPKYENDRNLDAALVEANEALAYREEQGKETVE